MAEPYRSFTSAVIPLPAENVDTDQIVPARYLKVTDKQGLAEALFRDWRFEPDGSLKDPPFVLDRPEMAGRRILLVGDNFGAGSSREHARLFELLADEPDAELTVDLAEQGILLPDGTTIDFDIDPFAKRMILAGTDELGYLLSKEAELEAWEAAHPPRIDARSA